MTGLTEAFAHFGVAGRNQRWSWSARSEDGATVVMTLWRDQFDYSTKPPRYRAVARSKDIEWLNRPGNSERLENLVWSCDYCDGMFRVVVIEAEDTNADSRRIKSSHAQDRMVGHILSLNRQTGEFEAEILDLNELQ